MHLGEMEIRRASVVGTGVDGGHAYLQGECEYEGRRVSVAALMESKAEEADLRDGDVVVQYSSANYTPGAGLLLGGCRLR
ncbi:MAG TPA: hypothetical protein VE913_17380 [Longimicrobium sp.]|nr:hypothetical protein [Longimicrobium sp.]